MLEELSGIYSAIVSDTLTVAPKNWSRLWLRTSCEEGAWSTGGYWELEDSDEVLFFEVPDKASHLFYEAWQVSLANNDHWSTALFRVDRPTTLQIIFGHEDLDDGSYSPVEDQAAFRARTFGDRPIRSTIDMSGATSLTREMLASGVIGQNP